MLGKFFKDFAAYLPSKLLPALTGFITAPILTRLLTTTEFGNYALAIGSYEFLFAMTCSGLGAGAVRFYLKYQTQNRLGTFYSMLGASAGLVVTLAAALSALLLRQFRGHLPADLYPLLLLSVLIFTVQATFSVFMQVLRAQERSKLYTRLELLANYGGLGLGLGLLYLFSWGVAGLLWGTFIAVALALLILLPRILRSNDGRVPMQRASSSDMGRLWQYAWPLALGNMAMWGLRLSDRYLIGVMRSRAEVGLYSAAYNISSKSIDILVSVFLLSLGPMVINIWERSGLEQTQQSLTATTRVFLILCLPATAGLAVLAQPFIQLLTAASYHEGYRIVGYVVFSSFIYGLAQIASVGLLIAKRTNQIAINQIVAVLITTGLNIWLIPRYGFVAAGMTTLIGYGTLLLLQAVSARPNLPWAFPFHTLRNVVLATGAMSVTAVVIYNLPGNDGRLHIGFLLLSVISAMLVYGLSLILLGELKKSEVTAVKQAVHNVAQRRRATSL